MANNTEDIKWLYDKLRAKGYDIGSQQEFTSSLANQADRDWYYDKAVGMGLDMGSKDDFNALYAPQPAKPAPASTPQQTSAPTAQADTAMTATLPPSPATPQSAPTANQGAQQPASAPAPQPTWQPTEQDKIRMAYNHNSMMSDFNARSRARVEQTRRATERMTPEGRRKLKAAKFQAQLAGTPTQVMGMTPDVSAAPSGQSGQGEGGEQAKPLLSGQGPVPYGVVEVDGQRKTQWLLPDGSLTTDFAEADKAEYGARRVRLMNQFVGRMKENGLDPSKKEDVQRQAQLDYEAPIRKAVAAAVQADDERSDKEQEAYTSNPLNMIGGVNAALGHAVSRKQAGIGDLSLIAENAYNSLPSAYRRDLIASYTDYFTQHPEDTHGKTIEQAATDAAKSVVYGQVHEEYVKRNGPQSKNEFFIRKMLELNPASVALSGTINPYGQAYAELDAMERYGAEHRGLDIAGMVAGMAMDPTTYLGGWAGNIAFKNATRAAGKVMAKKAMGDVAGRYASTTLAGRIIGGMAAGGANFGTFEAVKDAERQLYQGGYLNPETGEMEGFSFGSVLNSGVHGIGMGAATGVVSPLIGNVADGWVKATTSTAGKAALRTGETAVSKLFEGTIFAAPDVYAIQTMPDEQFDKLYSKQYGYDTLEDEQKKTDARKEARKDLSGDAWSESMAMMMGFGLSHAIKTAPAMIRSLRPVKPTGDCPLTRDERIHNNKSFAERLRERLDQSPSDISMSDEEREELKRKGYGNLSDLFAYDPEHKSRKVSTAQEAEGDYKGTTGLSRTVNYEPRPDEPGNPDFDGYESMERLMEDESVSEATRAKAYYILTGRMLPMSTVTGWSREDTDDGSIIITSLSHQGGIVTSRKFSGEKEAQAEIERIQRQSKLNTIDIGEQYRNAEAQERVMSAAIQEISPGADPQTVYNIYEAAKRGDKDVTEEQHHLADMIDEAIERNTSAGDDVRPEGIRDRISQETGVDIDKAIRKEPGKRTEAEQEAVKRYARELFPEQRTYEPTQEEAEADRIYEDSRLLYGRFEQGDPEAQAEIDAISLRMTEAHQLCEDAFGDEAEVYMAEIKENPWGTLNNPELTPDQKDAVLYYINAKAALDGVLDASNEAAADKRQKVQGEVAHRTHKERGVIIPATMKADDKPVYIIKGDVAMFPDGSGVDASNSSNHVIILDESGEYKFTSPDQILTVGETIDPQTELQTAYEAIDREQEAIISAAIEGVPESDEIVLNSGENEEIASETAEETPESVPNVQEYERGYEEGTQIATTLDDNILNAAIDDLRGRDFLSDEWRGRLEAYEYEQQRRQMEPQNAPAEVAGNNAAQNIPENDPEGDTTQSALERIPVDEQTGDPILTHESVDAETAWDAAMEFFGTPEDALKYIQSEADNAKTAITAAKKAIGKVKPTGGMTKYRNDLKAARDRVEAAKTTLAKWQAIEEAQKRRKAEEAAARAAETAVRNAQLHDEAVARFEEEQRIKAEKQSEQERIGTHAVNPKIKEKWDAATKIDGHPDVITLPDGSTLSGHYVMTEAGAASASHDVNNAFEPTEGFPIDKHGQSVNDRDYKRDRDAQQIVHNMADSYDSRAMQTPVFVSKDGIVLSGNNRTMSGDIAAAQGTDGAYLEYLSKYGAKYGFTPEQVAEMKHPRVVFVPDDDLPYDANTFSRFNAPEMKSQSKPEAAIKLGKIVDNAVFNRIVADLNRYDRLSDFYADQEAAARTLGDLVAAGVINDKQLPELRTGTALSAAGKELIENTLIGKIFQAEPDAVRMIISMPTLRQGVILGLNEIANNRTLAAKDYDLGKELSAAVDLVFRAKTASPDIYKDGIPVSPFGRMQGLFDDEYGDSRVTDATTLILADLFNSTKPSDVRKVLAMYNKSAGESAAGMVDIFSETGKPDTKEEILTRVNEHFRNATPKEQQALVDAAIEQRKREAEQAAAEQAGRGETGNETQSSDERSREPEQAAVEPEPVSEPEKNLTPEEEALTARIEVTENEWEEGDEKTPTYKREIIIDGKHKVIQVDAPDRKGDYTDSAFDYDGKTFSYLGEVADYIDKQQATKEEPQPDEPGDEKPIAGLEGYTRLEIKDIVKLEVEQTLSDADIDAEIVGMEIHGSRSRGDARPDSDLDIVLEYKGDAKEYAMFNAINETPIEIDGIQVDVNPIRKEETGTLPDYMKKSRSYDEEKIREAAASAPSLGERIAEAEATVNTEPTEAQKEAGNYRKGHVQVGTFDVTIENPKGSRRSGTDADGTPWETTMTHTYGYIKGTKGVDGDHIDVYLSSDIDDWDGRKVFVVDQYNPDGTFDEHKVMLGFNDRDEAYSAYLSNYEKGWEDGRRLDCTEVNLEDFEKWIESSKRKTKAFAEYKRVRTTCPVCGKAHISDYKSNDVTCPQCGTDLSVFRQIDQLTDDEAAELSDKFKGEDKQGNPIDHMGRLIVEDVMKIDEVCDGDFTNPTRTVGLPELPGKVSDAIGAEGRKPIIKKNIFVKNRDSHKDLTPEDGRKILKEVLYNPDLYGQNQKVKRPYNWILVHLAEKNSSVILEVNPTKDYLEIVNWHYLNGRQLEQKKRQAEREGGRILTLQESNAAGDASQGLSSGGKDNALLSDKQGKGAESSDGYTIMSTTYTNKKGKTSDVWLVKFGRDLSKEEKAALDTYIREPLAEGKKTSRGWYDRKEGGYMMRSEEAAKGLAAMLDNAEAVADAQPLSAKDYKDATRKPERTSEVPKPIPMNRVDVEGLFNDLSAKGGTKFSDHAESVSPKSEPEPKRMVVDDEMRDMENELRSLLGIDDSEGDRGDLFRNPEDFTNKERMQITSLGITYALKYFDQGIVSFPDFADKMVRRMGEKIRPWLKAFYGGARDIPGYDHLPFTPADEVKAFDVMNFDKAEKDTDPMRTAQGIVSESRAEVAVTDAQREITEQRNQKRKERDEQTTADTEAITKQAEATASEAEATAESAVDEQSIAAASEKIDEALEKVNDQLALLGYYESERVEKDYNEAYGYMRNAEKKALADAVKLAKQLVKDLGIEIGKVTGSTTAKKSKKRTAVTANIAPAGGDISIRLPLNEGRELYVSISLDPSVERGDVTYSGDNLQVTSIMYRVETPDASGYDRFGRNCWADVSTTYSDLLKAIQRESYKYLPEANAEGNEYKSGDSIQYSADGGKSWTDGKVVETNDDGSLKLDTGLAPVLYVNATQEQVRRKDLAKAEPGKKEPEQDTPAEVPESAIENAIETLTGKKKEVRKTEVKPKQVVGDLFGGLFDEPENSDNNVKRESDTKGQGMAKGERAHTVGDDETGTDGRVSSAGTEPTGKGGAADEKGAGVERGTDGSSHGTDADGGLQPRLGDRGRDEGDADSGSAGAAVERGGTTGAGTISERDVDRGAERLSEGEPVPKSGRGSRTPSVKKPKKPEVRYTRNFRYDEKEGNEADTYTPSQRLEANVKAIETLAEVLFGDKPATDEQRAVMSHFRGWGQVDLGKYYDIDHILRNTFSHTPIYRLAKAIQKVDPQGEKKLFDAIKRASMSSYYTPTPIARAMNTFLGLAGYKGGSLLDPSMGNGMYEGTLPKSIQERTAITGVELDWLSGQLSRLLYPDANVMIGGFEKSGIAPGSFDVVTSNVPFGDIVVNDPSWKNDATPVKRSAQNRIHNYYAVKMLEATRPGGLVAMLTTSAVMDTPSNQNIRAHIADQGEILGAIRLPDNTFQGTGVVTDMIFIRKWRDDQDRAKTREDAAYKELEQAFLSHYETTAPNKLDGKKEKVQLNGYFEKNPRNLIGEIQAGNQYGKHDAFGLTSKLSVDEIASEIEKAIKRIVGSRRGSIFNPTRTIREVQQAVREAYKGDGDWVSNGNLVIQDGKVGVLTAKSNEYGEVTRTFEGTLKHDKMLPRIKSMIEVRTAMKKLIAGQIEGSKELELMALRTELQKAYDNFVGKYGRLQDKDNSFILDDIDGYTIQALETWKNGKFVGLSDIFTKNSIKPALKLDGKKTPQEAVALSLAEYGYLRPDYLAKALGEDWAEQCGDFVFLKPNSEDDYVTRDEYLSGDVVTKLAEARSAAEKDKSFERNVKALEEVQPVRIPFDDIAIHLGARWIPETILNDFVNDLFGIQAVRSNRNGRWHPEKREYVYNQKSGVRYIPETDSFEINIEKKELGGAAQDWETPKKSAKEILQAALEDKTLLIKYKDKEGNEHIDEEQTELANQKIADLRERFESWLPSDPERVEMLEQTYNDRFNRTVIRHFDGSHLVVPGLMGKELRPHQKDAVWMLINNRGGIVDHIVGAGKTLVMQSAIMEMRRMGIAKKPLIVALKSTVSQIAREFKEAFPSARVLAPNDSDFKKENRKKFIANISLNDYDCIILSHEQYCMLPHTEEAERAVIDEQMWQLNNMIEYLYGTNDTSQMTKKQIKALEKRRNNLVASLEKRLDRNVDREFCFENLGIDYMFVDESHQFKSLPYVTSYQKVAGLGDAQGSSRAVALLTGIRHLQRMHQGDKGTVFLSGTTITNSLVEIYNLLNYLRPRKLEELGMPTFDAWASTFAVHSAELEAGVTGSFAMKDRFRSFDNVPELSQLYAEIADVRNDTNLKLPKPAVDGRTVIVPASDSMQEINAEIVNMLETKNGSYFGIHPKDPNRAPWGLHASTLSAKAAVSLRLIFPDMEDDGGKVHAICENVKKFYDEQADQRGVQLIFCEMGVPDKSKQYDAYTDMVNRFVNDYGIPRSEIAYIQEANSEEKRKDLFQRVRDGKVRILIGGTKNMGTGVNVQDRITDMHMLTVPWTPSALEQCIGRGARQGNLVARDFMDNKVRVHYYATEGSLDLYKYQLLDAKGKMFTQFKMGTVNGGRSFDEGSADEDGNIDPAEMVAILSGNPVIFERAKQEKVVKKLRALRNGFERDYQRKKAKQTELQTREERLTRLVRLNERDCADLAREGFKPDDNGVYPSKFTIMEGYSRYGDRTFDKPKEAGEYLLKMLEEGKDVTLQGFGQRAKVVTVNEEDAGGLFSSYRVLQIGDGERDIKYTVRLSENPTAAGTAFRNLLKRIIDNGEVFKRDLDETRRQLAGMNIGDGVFPKQAELDEAVSKFKELNAEYNKLGQVNSRVKNEHPKTIITPEDGSMLIASGNFIRIGNEISIGNSNVDGRLVMIVPNRGSNTAIFENNALKAFGISKTYHKPRKEYTLSFDRSVDTTDVLRTLRDTGYSLMEEPSTGTGLKDREKGPLFRFAETEGDFDMMLERAVSENGYATSGLADKELKTVQLEKHDFAGQRPISQAKEWARRHIVGTHMLADEEGNEIAYEISKRTIDKYLSSSAIDKSDNLGVHLAVLKALPEVIGESVEAEVHPDYLKGYDGKRRPENGYNPDALVHRFYGAVALSGQMYRVKTTIKEFRNNKLPAIPHSYEVTKIELLSEDNNSKMEPTVSPQTVGAPHGIANLLKNVEKSYGPGKKLIEAPQPDPKTMEGAVALISDKLNTPIRIISRKEAETEGYRRKKGWYDRETGQITIVADNHRNVGDIADTAVHEAVGHHGLRQLFGTEEKLNNFLDEAYNISNDKIKAEIDRRTERMMDDEVDRLRETMRKEREERGENPDAEYYNDMAKARIEAEKQREQIRRDATEEYASDLGMKIGEEGFERMDAEEQTFWGKLKGMLQKALDRLLAGLKLPKMRAWTDKEWSYVLWKSWRNLREGNRRSFFTEAEDIVRREKSNFGASESRLFRDSDMGLEEAITKMKADAAAANGAGFTAKQDAMRAIGGNLSKLRQAMARQREYDITTVKSMTDLSKILLDAGLLDDLSKYETKRILSAIKDAVGREDTSKQVQRLMDIMVDNQLRMGANYFGKLLSVKGSRIDARGIEVQGELDPDGQKIAQTVKKATTRTLDDIDNMMSEAMNRMSSTDQAVADEAALEYAGLQIARQYVEEIRESKNEEKELRKSIDDYKAERNAEAEDSKKSIEQARVHKDAGHMTEQDFNLLVHDIEDEERARWGAFKQYAEATNEAIRQNKIERAEAYRSLSEQLGGVLGESVERAKQWREAEKQRVEDIHHNANSDMKGMAARLYKKDGIKDDLLNIAADTLLSPLRTFEQMLKMFGSNSSRGEGCLYQRFMRQLMDALDNEWRGYSEAIAQLDEKVSQVFGKKMKWTDLYKIEKKLPKGKVNVWDDGKYVEIELKQGNLLYVYMVDKMTDGRMKLRRMGITEEAVERIKDFVDSRFIELADWIQEEFLVNKRNKYNEVYKRMFGTSMAAIENYFPIRVLKTALENKPEEEKHRGQTTVSAETTGAWKKRTRNNKPLDIMNANVISLIVEHLKEMEHAHSFSELSRDLNTLRKYKKFEARVRNMRSVYGVGEKLWNHFEECCSMATGDYKPPTSEFDRASMGFAKWATAAKIAFRFFTAFKQFASFPAFLADCRPDDFAFTAFNLKGSWKWAMENLPNFEKRWESRIAGDPILKRMENERGGSWKAAKEWLGRWGMASNAFVDGLTVAIGARAMYKTKVRKYRRWGLPEEEVQKRAKQDAEILFNLSQQSSESAFLSTIQSSGTFWSAMWTVFRNASMSYSRQVFDACRNLGHRFKPGYKEQSIEFMRKQMVRSGVAENIAEVEARREYRSGWARDVARVAIYAYVLPAMWYLFAKMPFLLLGNDEEKKKDMVKDALVHGTFGTVEGFAGGDLISDGLNMLMNGEMNLNGLEKNMPIVEDIRSTLRRFKTDEIAALNDLINIGVQVGLGVNPQTLEDMVVAALDFVENGDWNDVREYTFLIARIMNCPQSQLDEIYFDEIGMSGEEIAEIPRDKIPEVIAERYAEYKLHRNALLTEWAYDEEGRKKAMEKSRKKAKKTMKERMTSSLATERTRELLDSFDEVSDRQKELNRLKKTDREAYRTGMKELRESTNMIRHNRVKRYNHDIKRLTEKWMNAKTPQEADSIARAMLNARERLLIDVDSIEAQ